MNIPDIFFNSCFKNNLRKKKDLLKKKKHFHKNLGGKYVANGNHDKMCPQSFEI
jgi:hypothetical protein